MENAHETKPAKGNAYVWLLHGYKQPTLAFSSWELADAYQLEHPYYDRPRVEKLIMGTPGEGRAAIARASTK